MNEISDFKSQEKKKKLTNGKKLVDCFYRFGDKSAGSAGRDAQLRIGRESRFVKQIQTNSPIQI